MLFLGVFWAFAGRFPVGGCGRLDFEAKNDSNHRQQVGGVGAYTKRETRAVGARHTFAGVGGLTIRGRAVGARCVYMARGVRASLKNGCYPRAMRGALEIIIF